MGATIFFIVLVSFIIILVFIIRTHEKRIEEQKEQFDLIQQEAKKIMEKQGKDIAEKFIEEHINDLISMPVDFFYGRRYRAVKDFIFTVGNDYNDNDLKEIIIKGKYKEEDVKKFSSLIKEAMLN